MATNTSNGAGAPLIDTHAHLDFGDYDEDREQVISRAWGAGLVGIITVGIEPGDWAKTLSIAGEHARVNAALGIHPNSADQTNEGTLGELTRLCKDNAGQVVAIGETGLDYYRQYVPHDKQRESFRAHLDLARELDLPVIVHNRDAHADVLEILRRDGAGTRGVMHSFSGDLDFATACIEMGYMVSLSGPVSFKKASDKHLIARSVPIEHLLVETDCPFLTPEPYRGRRNEPLFVMYTARAIAQLRETSYEEIARVTTDNARRLFRIG